MSREHTKAAHYIQQLDDARCEGNWDALPELVRKIKKHAPERTCLALTAECEHAITQASQNRPTTARSGTARPSTAVSTSTQSAGIVRYIPLLVEAIEKEQTYVEDEFQARVCLGWVHWQLGELDAATARLPKSVEREYSQIDGASKESAQWTKVCALKASYIKGNAQAKAGVVAGALETYEDGLPIIACASTSKPGKELRSWAELFLTEFCLLLSQMMKTKVSSVLETKTLSAFRAWAKFWEAQGTIPTGGRAALADVPRRRVWHEYYVTISDLLLHNLPFSTTSLTTAYAETSTRLQQRAELKRVETRYETLLLSEVQFPKAEEVSDEVESFVDTVMQNWRILCGSSWKEEDLGEGGAEAVSKGVLDILYRAATKTFHSTAILRHLFTVHLAVAEFELALKAFDTYMEIVRKGKARVEKTGEQEHGLDDDETVLRTASECMRALCRYGSQHGAEKAQEIGQYFEDWLGKHHPISHRDGEDRHLANGMGGVVTPEVLAIAWRSIGIAHAQWARLSFDAPSRADVQTRAINCFRKALLPQHQSTTNVETLFALGTILAERGELAAAIEAVKSGLLPQSTTQPDEYGPHDGKFSRERSLIPLWHLMALLLSARQEFMTAARSCEGAFEQFQDPRNFFGEEDLNNGYRSEHLNNRLTPRHVGVVDNMDDFEKENVLEVKMTQLSLVEVLEGPEIAVNASDELLSLYTRLFGDPQKDSVASIVPPSTALAIPPKSSAGTIKSIKGSIFGRSNRSVRKASNMGPVSEEKAGALPRLQTTQTVVSTKAPTIQVTNENGGTSKQRRHLSTKERAPHHHEKLQKRSGSLTRKISSSRKRSSSVPRAVDVSGTSSSPAGHSPTLVDGEKFFTPQVESDQREQWLGGDWPSSRVGVAASPDNNSLTDASRTSTPSKPPPPISQQVSHPEKSLKPAISDQVPAQDSRLPQVSVHSPSTNPTTRFPKDQERRRRTAILVKVWLLISGFYRRASMYDDSRGAIEEAHKLVQSIESDVAKDSSGSVTIGDAGWGGGKSVKALWGDVFSERGSLAVAEASPYVALSYFESALTHFADHPSAIVGLSNILLDIYTGELLPPSSIPALILPSQMTTPTASSLNTTTAFVAAPIEPATSQKSVSSLYPIPHGPLGLPSVKLSPFGHSGRQPARAERHEPNTNASTTALLDSLAARDRAYGLLSGLTKLGTGWNYSEAWFALSRAYEEGGQIEKAKEVLWWCVELEEGRAVRDWTVIGGGGYVL